MGKKVVICMGEVVCPVNFIFIVSLGEKKFLCHSEIQGHKQQFY